MSNYLKAGYNQIIVKEQKVKEENKSGLYVPDLPHKFKFGVVTNVGRVNKDFDFYQDLLGKAVYFGEYVGTEIEFNGEKFIVIKVSDVMAVVEEGETEEQTRLFNEE